LGWRDKEREQKTERERDTIKGDYQRDKMGSKRNRVTDLLSCPRENPQPMRQTPAVRGAASASSIERYKKKKRVL